MAKTARPFVFTLNPDEVEELHKPVGQGGQQSFHRDLRDQLARTGNVISLNDEGIGKLIRYMTQYKGGGFQGRLRSAFERSLEQQIGIKVS